MKNFGIRFAHVFYFNINKTASELARLILENN